MDKQNQFLNRSLGSVGAIWGVCGALAILGYAVSKMVRATSEAFSYDLNVWHYLVMAVWTFFMAYSEGYKGFQKGYSPRVASRAVYLRDKCTGLRLALAPFFCLGFFHAPRKRKITVVILVIGISLIVLLFKYIPQPWRGVLDFGVIIGLSWGIIATVIYFAKFWVAKEVTFDPEVVEPDVSNAWIDN